MNGKIKTKFAALFAVALMITVCVVPVVGNEDVQAVVTDPSDAVSLTVSGAVYAASAANTNVPIAKSVELQISIGNENYKVYSANGSYSFETYVPKDSTISKIDVTLNATSQKIIDGSGNEVANGAYGLWTSNPTLTYTNVEMVSGKTISNVDFKAGYTTISGTLYYGNGSGNAGVYKTSTTVTLYEKIPGTSEGVTYSNAGYSATSVDGNFIIYVPFDLTTKTTGATGFAVGANISNATYADVSIGQSNVALNSTNKYVFTIGYAYEIDETLQISAPTGSNVRLETTSFTLDEEETVKEIVFTVDTSVQTPTMEIVISGTYGNVTNPTPAADGKITITNTNITAITYTQKNCIDGTIKMSGDVSALEGQVTLTILKDDGTTVVETYTSDVGKGTYEIWYENGLTDAKKFKVKYESGNYEVESSVKSLSGTKKTDLAVDGSKSYKVTIYVKNSSAQGIEGASVSVSGTNLFGLKDGVAVTDNTGKIVFRAEADTVVTITPDAAFDYDVTSLQLLLNNQKDVTFTMDSQEVQLEFLDYDGEPLTADVTITQYEMGDDGKWVSKGTVTDVNNKVTFNGNVDLSNLYVKFSATGRTFSDVPVAIGSITAPVKVLDTVHQIEILDNKGNPIVLTGLKVYVASAVLENGVSIYDIGSEYRALNYDEVSKRYWFAGVISNDAVTSTESDVIVVTDPSADYIFDDVYVVNKAETTTIQAYADVLTGAIYEADKKTPITTLGGSSVTLKYDGTTTLPGTYYVKKDGTFTINSKFVIEEVALLSIAPVDGSKYTFKNDMPVFDENEKVTKYFANEMSFNVKFNDADGKVIKYTNGKIKTVPGDTSGDISVDSNGVAVFQIPTDKKVGASLNANDETARSFQTIRITDEMISSKKIDFVSGQATYTVKLTDSKGDTWKSDETLQLIKVTDTVNTDISTLSYDDVKEKATAVLDVPVAGSSYVVKGINTNYFGMTEYAFTDYVATVPAIGSFVEVTAVEANGTVVKTSLFDNVSVYEKGTTTSALGIDDNTTVNVVKYFAIDGKEYEFNVEGKTPYSFGNEDVNGGKISAVDGLLLANEETVKGQVTFANGYNDFTAYTTVVTAKYKEGGSPILGTFGSDKDGSYKIIVDVDKVEKYEATITGVANGSSSTPEIVLDESYITGSAPSDDVEAAVYKDGAFVKSLDVQVNDGKYVLIVDASDGDEIVMTITASGKTFQQAIDLKAVQNDIIVPGSLVSDKTNALFADFYVIYGADTAVIGSKIVLSAKNAVSIQMDVANVAYTTLVFDGWYVNGEKVSDDVNATYTVNGPCEVYAYYTEKVTETGAVADSSNDLSMDVLILGIVIVVLALLAFVYAVKFKKE